MSAWMEGKELQQSCTGNAFGDDVREDWKWAGAAVVRCQPALGEAMVFQRCLRCMKPPD